jgi:GT2 family glycosyltransferase
MVSRVALAAVGGFDETLPSCQDWDLWIRLREYGEIAVVPDPLMVFEQTQSDRISSTPQIVMPKVSRRFQVHRRN